MFQISFHLNRSGKRTKFHLDPRGTRIVYIRPKGWTQYIFPCSQHHEHTCMYIYIDQKWIYIKLQSASSRFEHCSNHSLNFACKCCLNKRPPGLIAPPFSIGFLITEHLLKAKLGQVKVGSNITQNHSSRLYEVISCHYLPPNSYQELTKSEIK